MCHDKELSTILYPSTTILNHSALLHHHSKPKINARVVITIYFLHYYSKPNYTVNVICL